MSTEVETALRALQKLDEAHNLGDHRHFLIEALTALGAELGLECTGVVDGTNPDGSPAYFSHNGDTCPIHEWLVPEDSRESGEGDLPFIAFGNAELGDSPPLHIGEAILCPHCGESHIVEGGKNEAGEVVDTLLFYKCGDTSYLAGVGGKNVMRGFMR